MGLFGKPSAPPPARLADVIARLEEVEDAVRRMDRRFTKLQGEFGALVRDYVEEDDSDDEFTEELRRRRG
jgi:predicted transcriptional regulator